MDTIGKKCLHLGENMYTYKGLVKVMSLAMSLLTMAKYGLDSTNMNIKVNSEIELNKLKLHTPNEQGKSRCLTMHIRKQTRPCRYLKVHGYPMVKVSSDVYLGDIISSNGSNKLNIENRRQKDLA